MELSDYFRILRQRGWIIILTAILTAAAAFGYSRIQPVVYESNVNLLVRPARLDFGQTQAVKELLGGYEAWLQSRFRAQEVIDTLQLDMTPDQLMGDVSFASDSLQRRVQISVENSNQMVASDIAIAWGNLLIQDQQTQNDRNRQEDRIDIIFQDAPATRQASPQTRINTLAGGVFGILLGTILIFVLEWLESGVIRRSEDVEKYLDVPIVGSIPNQ